MDGHLKVLRNRSRDERISGFETIDCTMVARREGLKIDADAIDFEMGVFERRINRWGASYIETARLLRAFVDSALSVRGMGKLRFIDFSHVTTLGEWWHCRVYAYNCPATGIRCLEFCEVS